MVVPINFLRRSFLRILPVFLLFSFQFCNGTTKKQSALEKGRNGQKIPAATDYVIVVPKNATSDEQNAAKALQKYLAQMTDKTFPIIDDTKASTDKEFIIGKNSRLKQLGQIIPFNKLGDDGFVIKTVGNKVILAGGPRKGSTYAVYTLLEKYLNCRKYTPDYTVIPHVSTLTIPAIANDMQVPAINLRVQNFIADKNDYYDWHKLNSIGKDNTEWGQWVCELDKLVPPQTYFRSHPEYFAYRSDKKNRVTGQLCLTNEDVYKISLANLRAQIMANPKAKYWSVCQNDNWDFCQCDNCKRLDDQYASHQGSILTFVNRLAANFPDKIISTHAYTYSVVPPQGLKPASNVLIVFSTINSDRSKPMATDVHGGDLRKYLAGWNQITDKLYVWDYVVQFSSYISIFPNIKTLQPNLQFFSKNGVTGVFEQASGFVPADFSELKAYMLNKLMWDPNSNGAKVKEDFLNGYYGKAAGKIKEYLQLSEDAASNSSQKLEIYGSPGDAANSYLSPGLIKKYLQLFKDAESLVADDARSLGHVQLAKLSVDYSILALYKPRGGQPLAKSMNVTARAAAPAVNAMQGINISDVYNDFIQTCQKNNIDLLSTYNGDYRLKNFQQEWQNISK